MEELEKKIAFLIEDNDRLWEKLHVLQKQINRIDDDLDIVIELNDLNFER